TQLGLALMIGILCAGLGSIIAPAGAWFDWLRLAGAVYLVWLGIKLLHGGGTDERSTVPPPPPRSSFFLQGLFVMLSNPKVLLFFGALIPQFMDPNADPVPQVVLLGATFMAIVGLCDAAYAVLVGKMGLALSKRRVRLVSNL